MMGATSWTPIGGNVIGPLWLGNKTVAVVNGWELGTGAAKRYEMTAYFYDAAMMLVASGAYADATAGDGPTDAHWVDWKHTVSIPVGTALEWQHMMTAGCGNGQALLVSQHGAYCITDEGRFYRTCVWEKPVDATTGAEVTVYPVKGEHPLTATGDWRGVFPCGYLLGDGKLYWQGVSFASNAFEIATDEATPHYMVHRIDGGGLARHDEDPWGEVTVGWKPSPFAPLGPSEMALFRLTDTKLVLHSWTDAGIEAVEDGSSPLSADMGNGDRYFAAGLASVYGGGALAWVTSSGTKLAALGRTVTAGVETQTQTTMANGGGSYHGAWAWPVDGSRFAMFSRATDGADKVLTIRSLTTGIAERTITVADDNSGETYDPLFAADVPAFDAGGYASRILCGRV